MHFVDLIQLGEKGQAPPKEIQLLRAGTWEHPKYGKVDITSDTLKHIKRNFDDRVRGVDIAIDSEHKPEEGAKAWLRRLSVKDDGRELWGHVDWTPDGQDLVMKRIYRYTSAEYTPEYKDPETGKVYKDVLMGAALTNRPFIKEMHPVLLSETVAREYKGKKTFKEEASSMKITKDPALQNMQKIEENKGDDETKAIGDVATDLRLLTEAVMNETPAKASIIQDLHASYTALSDIVARRQQAEIIKLSEDNISRNPEIIKLKEKLDENERRLAKQERDNVLRFAEDTVNVLICDEENVGRVLPKSKDKLVRLFSEVGQEHAEMLLEFVEELPAVIDYNERGTDAGGDKLPERAVYEADPKKLSEIAAKMDEATKTGLSLREAAKQVGRQFKE